MRKIFNFKAIFLLLILVIGFSCVEPKTLIKAQGENPTASIYYALVSLGYEDIKDKNSLIVEECIGVRLTNLNLNSTKNQEILNDVYANMKNYKQELENLVLVKKLGNFMVLGEIKIDGDFIYIKIRYLNIIAYYSFNNRIKPDTNGSKLYDKKENVGLYNRYYIYLNNPFGEKGAQISLNTFKNNHYEKIVSSMQLKLNSFDINYVFDYSSNDNRLYGDYEYKYSLSGLNSNTIYIYEFVFDTHIKDTLSVYFITFNQYLWYVVAIAVTLVVIGIMYLIVFFKKKKDKKKVKNVEN